MDDRLEFAAGAIVILATLTTSLLLIFAGALEIEKAVSSKKTNVKIPCYDRNDNLILGVQCEENINSQASHGLTLIFIGIFLLFVILLAFYYHYEQKRFYRRH